jgi:hypothetical protein
MDQVDIDRREAMCARGVDHGPRFLLGLNAVDGALHRRVEILDADRDAIEAELADKGDRLV